MGRGWKKHRNANSTQTPKPRTASSEIVFTNANLENYYRALEIIKDENEWKSFLEACRRVLPTTLRVTASRPDAKDVNDIIKEVYVPLLSKVEHEGEVLEPPKQLPWYPNGMAWQLNVAKQAVRKLPQFAQFQRFLVHETDAGNVSRQEAVSMVPPLLLDVEPHHFILDCCAAPGSKTVQLLEALHSSQDDDATGLLLANDSDPKRTHMLVHQSLVRVGSPNMMVTNHDFTLFPNLRMKRADLDDTRPQIVLFDRILADVPCSGDGTMRKNVLIWRDWHLGNGFGLHALQLRILKRAIQVLKPGGRLVYSTCSLNPIENEAVVSSALASHSDMSLVDISARLPGLERRPGLLSWKVILDVSNFAGLERPETEEVFIGEKKLLRTMWPNGRENELHLDRCIRIYPHLQDTGGFFVAVLEKAARPGTANIAEGESAEIVVQSEANGANDHITFEPIEQSNPVQALEDSKEAESGEANDSKRKAEDPAKEDQPPLKKLEAEQQHEANGTPSTSIDKIKDSMSSTGKRNGREFKEDPFSYIPDGNEEMTGAFKFFDILPTFAPNLLVRNDKGEPVRTVYRTSDSVRSVITMNNHDRMRLVACGTKLFGRQDSGDSYNCRWRIMNDSIIGMRRHLGSKRIVQGTVEDLRKLMVQYVPHEKFEGTEFGEKLAKLSFGSGAMEILPSEQAETSEGGSSISGLLRHRLVLPIWRSPISVQLMLEKKDKISLSYRCFGEDLTVWKVHDANKASKGSPLPISSSQLQADADSLENGIAELLEANGETIDETAISKIEDE